MSKPMILTEEERRAQTRRQIVQAIALAVLGLVIGVVLFLKGPYAEHQNLNGQLDRAKHPAVSRPNIAPDAGTVNVAQTAFNRNLSADALQQQVEAIASAAHVQVTALSTTGNARAGTIAGLSATVSASGTVPAVFKFMADLTGMLSYTPQGQMRATGPALSVISEQMQPANTFGDATVTLTVTAPGSTGVKVAQPSSKNGGGFAPELSTRINNLVGHGWQPGAGTLSQSYRQGVETKVKLNFSAIYGLQSPDGEQLYLYQLSSAERVPAATLKLMAISPQSQIAQGSGQVIYQLVPGSKPAPPVQNVIALSEQGT